MKFTFDRDAMIKEISIAQEIITNKSPISILSNILVIAENNALTIKATDSTVKFTTSLPVDIQEEGRTTIFCDKFMSILSSLPAGEIEFIQENAGVTIKPISKRVIFKLKSQSSEKFPEIGNSEQVPFFEIASKDFKEMIRHTVFAVGTDRNRVFMTGVFIEKRNDNLITVATDGRRLSCVTKSAVNVNDFQSAIVPTKIFNCVLKNAPEEGNIKVAIIDREIFVKFANYEFSSLLYDGQFPNYQRVIPENLTTSIMINKNDLEAALKRTTIMVDKKVQKIIFKISSGVLKLISPESELGTADEEIPCRYDGPDISMAFNFNYVIEPLKVIETENIIIEFTANDNGSGDEITVTKAVVMKSEPAGSYIHVVMPMNC